MAIPYTYGDFTEARVTGHFRSYPLQDLGSPGALVHNLICEMNEVDYSKPALNTAMDTASNAQVIALPYADSSAYFVGDTGHQSLSGGLVKFTRKFATKPEATTNRLVGSRSFPFPSIATVVPVAPSTAEEANTDENLYEYSTTINNSRPAPLYESRTYWIDGVDTAPTIPDTFVPTLGGSPVDFVADEYASTWSNAKALNGESYTAVLLISATAPTKTEYLASITNGDLKTVDVVVEPYMGNIFVLREFKMKAQ